MARKARVRETSEDALFAKLINEVAEIEGKLLNEEYERLKQDPDAEAPKELDEKSLQTIRRAFRRKRNREILSKALHAMIYAAVTIGVVCNVISCAKSVQKMNEERS